MNLLARQREWLFGSPSRWNNYSFVRLSHRLATDFEDQVTTSSGLLPLTIPGETECSARDKLFRLALWFIDEIKRAHCTKVEFCCGRNWQKHEIGEFASNSFIHIVKTCSVKCANYESYGEAVKCNRGHDSRQKGSVHGIASLSLVLYSEYEILFSETCFLIINLSFTYLNCSICWGRDTKKGIQMGK